MPGQFGGNKATPVGAGRRVLGHLLWMAGLLIYYEIGRASCRERV